MTNGRTIGFGIVGAGVRGPYPLGARIVNTTGETDFRIHALCDTNETRLVEGRVRLTCGFAATGMIIAAHDAMDGGRLTVELADMRVH